MLTIRPPPVLAMRPATSRAISQAPLRLVSSTRSQSASPVSSSGLSMTMPALFTRIEIGPSPASAAAIPSAMAAGSVTSRTTARASPPDASIEAASSDRGPARRAASATLAPALARVRANRRPSPPEAPVTMATWPASENILAMVAPPPAGSGPLMVPRGPWPARAG